MSDDQPKIPVPHRGKVERPRGTDGRFLSGDCSVDCVNVCAYPGRFSECGVLPDELEKKVGRAAIEEIREQLHGSRA